MTVRAIDDPADPRVRDFRDLTDVAARSAKEPAEGLFVAEGAKVIRRALRAGYRTRAVLTEPKWLPELEADLDAIDTEILLATPDVLRAITGYRVHRGALASMQRRALPSVRDVLAGAGLVVVLVDLVDHTNVGAVFRNAAALGADAVLVSPGCADPLYRRSIKVSMGAALTLPWTRTGPDPIADLTGWIMFALTPDPAAEDIDALVLPAGPRALLLGTEGAGLPPALMARVDRRVRIPMADGVDSLNVGAASAIALHVMRQGVPS